MLPPPHGVAPAFRARRPFFPPHVLLLRCVDYSVTTLLPTSLSVSPDPARPRSLLTARIHTSTRTFFKMKASWRASCSWCSSSLSHRKLALFSHTSPGCCHTSPSGRGEGGAPGTDLDGTGASALSRPVPPPVREAPATSPGDVSVESSPFGGAVKVLFSCSSTAGFDSCVRSILLRT